MVNSVSKSCDTRLDRGALTLAIARGSAFLERAAATSVDGLWRDYVEPDGSGGSTEWVSGFVAAQIGQIEECQEVAVGVVRALLASARPSGGWGYRAGVLEDCDSTAWVLTAAAHARVRLPRSLAMTSVRFLLKHQTTSGGFATYGSFGREVFGQVTCREGWFEPQTCVTSAVLLALAAARLHDSLPAERAARYLIDQRTAGPLWRAYWWHGTAYATYHASAALTNAEQLSPDEVRQVARHVLAARLHDSGWEGRQQGRGTSFATALSLLTLLLWSGDLEFQVPIEDSVEWLLARQSDDGSFMPSAELYVPGGSAGEALERLDAGIFTTACALRALDASRRYLFTSRV